MNDSIDKEQDIPPPPEKPLPQDCCGGGCVPCVLDVYEQALDAWMKKYGSRVRKP